MKFFTLVVSAVFVLIGILMIADGTPYGWAVTGFFACCLLVALFEDRLPRPDVSSGYKLVITGDEIACEHWKRKREAIRWDDVIRVWYVTTAEGPRFPDEWLLFEAESGGGCSFPTEAEGMDGVWDELKRRFPGFDYEPMIKGGTIEARHLCWERGAMIPEGVNR